MKYLVLIVLGVLLSWIVYILTANRRKSSRDNGAVGSDGGDFGGGVSSGCDNGDGSCGGDGGGGD